MGRTLQALGQFWFSAWLRQPSVHGLAVLNIATRMYQTFALPRREDVKTQELYPPRPLIPSKDGNQFIFSAGLRPPSVHGLAVLSLAALALNLALPRREDVKTQEF